MIDHDQRLTRLLTRVLLETGHARAFAGFLTPHRCLLLLLRPDHYTCCAHTKNTRATQVGGWRVDYRGGLTFATLRNAGHMGPYTQPERSYALLSQFLFGDAPPSATTSDSIGGGSSGGPAAA